MIRISDNRVADPVDTAQCALKLWHLQGLFRRLAREWGLGHGLNRHWPGLYLCRQNLLGRLRLELRLQPEYLGDGREFYEFRFRQAWPGFLALPVRHDFACGQLDADQLLNERRLRRELAEKSLLLGLVSSRRQPNPLGPLSGP